jgi:hypothetical protein
MITAFLAWLMLAVLGVVLGCGAEAAQHTMSA